MWIALLQHYGVPTRLLDFSTSPYISLYFALEYFEKDQVEDMALYCIDYRSLLKESIQYIKSKDRSFTLDYLDVITQQDEIFTSIISRFSYDILWITEPKIMNTRIERQAGTFLVSGNNSLEIEALLNDKMYVNIDCQKLIISKKLAPSIFFLLQKVNINSKTIYGDLSGLGRSIRMNLIAYS